MTDDHWLRLRDIGHLDEEGYLNVIGRDQNGILAIENFDPKPHLDGRLITNNSLTLQIFVKQQVSSYNQT